MGKRYWAPCSLVKGLLTMFVGVVALRYQHHTTHVLRGNTFKLKKCYKMIYSLPYVFYSVTYTCLANKYITDDSHLYKCGPFREKICGFLMAGSTWPNYSLWFQFFETKTLNDNLLNFIWQFNASKMNIGSSQLCQLLWY